MPTALPSEKRLHDVDDEGISEADDVILPMSGSNELPFVGAGIYCQSFICLTYPSQRNQSTLPHRSRRVSLPQLFGAKELATRL